MLSIGPEVLKTGENQRAQVSCKHNRNITVDAVMENRNALEEEGHFLRTTCPISSANILPKQGNGQDYDKHIGRRE